MRTTPSKFARIRQSDGMCEVVAIKRLYNLLRSQRVAEWCLEKALQYETPFFSLTARTIMSERFGISIGAYSYGACFDPSSFRAGTVIGRYVSIAERVVEYRANHPLDRLSTHPFFFNHHLGYVPEMNVPFSRLTIEHDAWIGDSVIITPGCQRIGLGAIVGAGSVVTKDVPDFAVVGGNPARLIKWRFSTEMQQCVRQSKWWERPIGECAKYVEFMSRPLTDSAATHPLLQGTSRSYSEKGDANHPVAAS